MGHFGGGNYAMRCYTTDGVHLLAEPWRPVRLMMFISGRQGTIPCRPTSPNITVTLKKSTRVVALNDNVVFDRRVGFTVRRANAYFDGNFMCIAALDGLTYRQRVIITYKGEY